MARKLNEKYNKAGLEINFDKTNYPDTSDEANQNQKISILNIYRVSNIINKNLNWDRNWDLKSIRLEKNSNTIAESSTMEQSY